MKKLAFPAVDDLVKTDEIVQARQAGSNAAAFTGYHAIWRREADLYHRMFTTYGWVKKYKSHGMQLKTALINLYNSADNDNERVYICQIRENHQSQCCPMCGRPGADTIDHVLPKDEYPQFSLLSKNLVPCCERCNRVKNKSIPTSSKTRYLHPYYDQFLTDQVIQLDIRFYNDIPIFKIIPCNGLSAEQQSIVAFHIKELKINTKIIMHYRNTWRAFLKTIEKLWGQEDTIDKVVLRLNERLDGFIDLKDDEFETRNNWDSIFFRTFKNDHTLLREIIRKKAPVV